MRVVRTAAEYTEFRGEFDSTRTFIPKTVAFVPTMGALHDGHRSLMRLARSMADLVVVSVFVNPLQFGPNEDYDRYPRTLDDDLEACRAEGVGCVFVPSVAEMYPAGRQILINAGQMGAVLEGASRPGHFDGMLTVVLKLLNIARPDFAIFGQKDAQQLALIRRMVIDLNLDVEIVGAPIVREADGLALSSRNRFLTPTDRTMATALFRSLSAAVGAATADEALTQARESLATASHAPGFDLDYLSLVNPGSLVPVDPDHTGTALLAVAARVGVTRLIDNVLLELGQAEVPEPSAPATASSTATH